jgi:hypothetical protein
VGLCRWRDSTLYYGRRQSSRPCRQSSKINHY